MKQRPTDKEILDWVERERPNIEWWENPPVCLLDTSGVNISRIRQGKTLREAAAKAMGRKGK